MIKTRQVRNNKFLYGGLYQDIDLGLNRLGLFQDGSNPLTPNGNLSNPPYPSNQIVYNDSRNPKRTWDEYIADNVQPIITGKETETPLENLERLVKSYPANKLTNSQLAIVTAQITTDINDFNKGSSFTGILNNEHSDKAAVQKEMQTVLTSYLDAAREREQYVTEYAKQEHNADIQMRTDFEKQEHSATIQKRSDQQRFQDAKAAAKPLVDAQNEANRLAKKEQDGKVIDVNEFKAFDIIIDRQLQDAKKFEEFTNQVTSGDKDALKDLKTLQASLHKDGKYSGLDDNKLSKLRAGVEALISENAEALEKYAKAQEAIHSLSVPSAAPAQELNKTIEVTK